jgi:hypothetical protein
LGGEKGDFLWVAGRTLIQRFLFAMIRIFKLSAGKDSVKDKPENKQNCPVRRSSPSGQKDEAQI